MEYAVTFLEGVITFVSPCLLPMLPIYIAYFAGGGDASRPRDMRKTLSCAFCFVAGFTVLFVCLGAFAGTFGSLVGAGGGGGVLDVVCGIVVIVFGLNYLGILRIGFLQRTLKPKSDIVPRGPLSSFLFGVVFAVGWTPCVGAFLGSALSMAASSAQTGTGILLLLCYSLGLGVPFVLAAVLIDQLEGSFAWIRRHYDVVDKVCGILLVVVGVLMATGTLGAWMRLLSF